MAAKITRYFAYTLPGIEEIAWLEIRDRLPGASFVETLFIKDRQGIVVFDYAGSPEDVLALRTTEEVFVQALLLRKLSRSRRDLLTIHEQVWKGESFGQATNAMMRFRAFSRPPSYQINTHVFGRHQYKNKDLTQSILNGMGRRLSRWRPQAQGAQVEVIVNLLGSNLLIGLRLSDKSMADRYRRHRVATADLRPSLAAALVQLTNPRPNDIFLDPLCHSGMILRERKMLPYGQLMGGDPNPTETRAAWGNNRNWKRRRMAKNLHILQWQTGQLPLAAAAVDKICTSLPAAAHGAAPTQALYTDFLNDLGRVLKPAGTAVFLSSEYELVKDSMRHVPHLAIETGYSVLADGRWQRIYTVSPPD